MIVVVVVVVAVVVVVVVIGSSTYISFKVESGWSDGGGGKSN